MLIDIIAFALLLLAVFKGLRKGLIVAAFSFLAFFIGLAAAIKLSAMMADYIGGNVTVSGRWLPFVAFLLVFLLVVLLVRLGARLLQRLVQTVMLGWANRLGGVLFYALLYFFIYSVLLFYATQLSLIKPATIRSSSTYDWIEPYAPKLISWLGAVIPFFKTCLPNCFAFLTKQETEAVKAKRQRRTEALAARCFLPAVFISLSDDMYPFSQKAERKTRNQKFQFFSACLCFRACIHS